MIKLEVIYEGSKRKISLSDGRVLEMTDGRIISMPEQDWYSTYSKTGNFKLVGKEDDIKEVGFFGEGSESDSGTSFKEEENLEEKPKKKKKKRGY